jgi:hypothetical protein
VYACEDLECIPGVHEVDSNKVKKGVKTTELGPQVKMSQQQLANKILI